MGILFDQSLNTSDSPTFGGLNVEGVAYVKSSGGAVRWSLDGNANLISQNATGGPRLGSGGVPYSFVGDTSTGFDTDGSGTLIWIANANTVEQRNGVNGQQLSIFNTFTDSSNYERATLKWSGNDFIIGTERDGTGSTRTIQFQIGGSNKFELTSTWVDVASLRPNADGTRYLGDASRRWDRVYSEKVFINSGTLTSSAPLLDLSQTWNEGSTAFTGIVSNITDTASASTSKLLDLQVGGTSKFEVNKSGSVTSSGLTVNGSTAIDGAFTLTTPSGSGPDVKVKVDDGSAVFELYSYSGNSSPYLRVGGSTPGTSGATTIRHFETSGNHFSNFGNKDGASFFSIHQSDAATTLQSDGYRGFSDSSTASYAASPDTRLYRDGADILAMRNGATANEFRVYNTFTDSSNYERASLKWSSNIFRIETENDGTGSARELLLNSAGTNLYLRQGGSDGIRILSSRVKTYRDLTFNGNTDIGLGANNESPRYIYGNRQLHLSGYTATTSVPLLDLSQTWNDAAVEFTGIVSNITNTASAAGSKLVDLQVDGSSVFEIDSAGSLLSTGASGNLGSTTDPWGKIYATNLYSASGGNRFQIGNSETVFYKPFWTSSGSNYIGWSSSVGGKFYGGGGGIIEQYGGTTAQQFSVHNTRTDDSNYERFNIRWASNACYLETDYAGTGTYRNLFFRARNLNYFYLDTGAQVIKIERNVYPSSNNSKRLGWATLRWTVTYTHDLDADGDVTFGSLPTSDPASAGQLWNDSGTVKISAG